MIHARSLGQALRLHLGVMRHVADLILHARRDKKRGWGEST